MPLDAAITALVGPAQPAAIESVDISADDRLEAMKLYVRGKTKLSERQFEGALTDLDRATTLDPNAAEAWREKAEALQGLSRRSSAIAAYQRAADAGITDPRVFLLLARDSRRAGRVDDAAKTLAKAWNLAKEHASPQLRTLIAAEFGDSLMRLGRWTAGAEAMSSALRSAPESISQSMYAGEIAEISRRRGELWVNVGDVAFRFGKYAEALDAYEQAAAAPGMPADAINPRRTAALLKLGRTADAALIALDQLKESPGPVSDAQAAGLRFLATRTSAGPALRTEVRGLSTVWPATPSAQAGLARAFAATAPDAQGVRDALLAGIAIDPAREELLADLLNGYDDRDTKGRVDTLLRLIDQHPALASDISGALLQFGRGLTPTVELLRSRTKEPAAALLLSSLLSQLGKGDEAAKSLTTAQSAQTAEARTSPIRIAMLGLQGRLLAQLGRWSDAEAAIQPLASSPGVPAAVARATALSAMLRPGDALKVLSDALGDASQDETKRNGASPSAESRDALVFASELALSTRQLEQAEAFARRAIACDNSHERGYEILLELYQQGRALADARKFADTARALREASPDGRVIRGLRAQDLVARGVLPASERELVSLTRPDFEDPPTLALLSLIWERAAKSDKDLSTRGATWLRERLDRHPDSPHLCVALARVLAAQGKGAEAESVLVGMLDRWPIPDLARMRERLVRESLNEPARADELLRSRLSAGSSSVDDLIDLADLESRTKSADDAINALASALPPRVPLSAEQSGRVAVILSLFEPNGKAPADLRGAMKLFDAVEDALGGIPPKLANASLICRAGAIDGEPDRLYKGLEAVIRTNPAQADKLLSTLMQVLISKPSPRDALEVLAIMLNSLPAAQPTFFQIMLQLAGEKATKDDAVAMTARLTSPPRLRELMRSFGRPNEEPPRDLAALQIELLHTTANFASNFGRDNVAAEIYRVILQRDPTHAWSANNLGYMLLEQDGDLAEASRLIELAAKQLPTEASITDSLGWLRYKQGRIDDDAQGPGALTLLQRASVLLQAALDNETIHDHLGDALWRGGRRDDAISQWKKALELAENDRRAMDARGEKSFPKDSPFRLKTMAIIASTNAKITAATTGVEPAVSPLHPSVQAGK